MYVLDSSVLIELLAEGPLLPKILKTVGEESPVTTTISVHEVHVGLNTEKQRFIFEGILSTTRILEHDISAARAGAKIEQSLLKGGTKIERADTFIAGICKTYDATLITLDKDFSKIKDIKSVVIS